MREMLLLSGRKNRRSGFLVSAAIRNALRTVVPNAVLSITLASGSVERPFVQMRDANDRHAMVGGQFSERG